MTNTRRATADDQAFLEEIFAIAVDWRGNPVRPVDEIMAEPGLARYIQSFPQEGDLGLVAESSDGLLGATWYRFATVEEPTYGFVDEATPELVLGLVASARKRGLGTRLLQELITQAKGEQLEAMSLSVDNKNPAMRIYERLGFVVVEEKTGEDGETHSTMLLRLT